MLKMGLSSIIIFVNFFISVNLGQKIIFMGSGCGSVGREVASDTRGPLFKSSSRQIFNYIEHLFTVNCVLKRRK